MSKVYLERVLLAIEIYLNNPFSSPNIANNARPKQNKMFPWVWWSWLKEIIPTEIQEMPTDNLQRYPLFIEISLSVQNSHTSCKPLKSKGVRLLIA